MASAAAAVGPTLERGAAWRVAGDYARVLLADCGVAPSRGPEAAPHPALDWARSGAMALTGPEDEPRLAPGPLAACARGAVQALRRLSQALPQTLDGPALLGERAALLGLRPRGRISAGGSCRLLRAADGWIAVSLARPDDLALLPAWLGEGDASDPWSFVTRRVARGAAGELVERARLLGLPVAPAAPPDGGTPPWRRRAARGTPVERAPGARPLVVDLSSLWAGPLCTHLLGLAEARVVKVESTRRPDGARFGSAPFFDLLNAGKESVALDVATAAGRAHLAGLVSRADVVVESARPRALAQLGIDAEALVRDVPGITWVSITGYGRREPGARWVAFGDDAAVAAGLAVATGEPDAPLFCGDAIADPLAGLHAAVAALASFRGGGGELIDVSLRDVAAHALGFAPGAGAAQVRACAEGWEVHVGGARAAVLPPRARAVRGRARPLGADTQAVLRELAC